MVPAIAPQTAISPISWLAHHRRNGDVTLVARVASQTNTSVYAKAGVMVG